MMRDAYAGRMCQLHKHDAYARTDERTNKDGEPTYVPYKSSLWSTHAKKGER